MPASAQPMTGSQARAVTYCVIPADLAGELHEYLRRHWLDDPTVEVIVERRRQDRRTRERRRLRGATPRGVERRSVRNTRGRRVADRRAASSRVLAPPLPRRVRKHARRLTFVLRRLPSSQAVEDAQTARLVVEYQLGDLSALEDIYLRYFDRVYAYARVALRSAHDAEDVTQQVFTRVVEALPRYELRRGTPFRAWLFRIARNTILDTRTVLLRAHPEQPARIEVMRDRPTSDAAQEALAWLTDADLYRHVERLPASQREVLVLRYLLDMPTKEIATALDRSPQTVRQQLSRALRALEQQLAAAGKTHGRTDPSPMLMLRHAPQRPVLGARKHALDAHR